MSMASREQYVVTYGYGEIFHIFADEVQVNAHSVDFLIDHVIIGIAYFATAKKVQKYVGGLSYDDWPIIWQGRLAVNKENKETNPTNQPTPASTNAQE